MKKFIVILLLFPFLLAGQQIKSISKAGDSTRNKGYDEKSIMKKQAERYSTRRKYETANMIYLDLINKFPDDWEIVEDLLNNYLRVSEYEKADELLEKKKEIMPEYNFLRIKIPLLIRNGDTKKAYNLGDKFIDKNRNNVNVYKDLARIFSGSRQYEKSAEILEKVRNVTKDEYLFTLDLARSYQSQELNKRAAREYLKHLERNKHYLHYVMNNLKGILNRDPTVIESVEKFSRQADNKVVSEAYALCLAHLQKFDLALLQYQKLDSIKLLNFAEELTKMKKYEIALKAYQQYEDSVKEPDLQAEAQLAKADIYIELGEFSKAENELNLIYENKKITNSKYRYRTQAAKRARLMLADLAVRLDKPSSVVIDYLQEAAQYSNNQMERKEIKFAVIDYQIKTENLDTAKEQLTDLLKSEEEGTDIYKQSLFYTWQIALMQKDALADSLLGELILNLPQNRFTTQALYLTQISVSLPKEFHQELFQAWRLRGLYKNKEAVEVLESIIELTGNDEIQLLAAEWQKNENPQKSMFWWESDYENELLNEYSQFMIMENTISDSLRQELITSFLKENPQSIFAPGFRNELNRIKQEN